VRILISNDDGIDADGIAVLEEIARGISNDVWVVAPDIEHSGAGHSLSLHTPLRLKKRGEKRYSVAGTPTDSVLMAILEVMQDKPDLLLSGVNRGLNVAEDVTYSGTIAAAMEGTLLDIPSIALSQQVKLNEEVHWDVPRRYASQIIVKLVESGWPRGNLMNVNFPHCTPDEVDGVKICPQGRRKIGEKLVKRTDPKGRDYYWIGGPGDEPYDDLPGADYMQIQKKRITVTPLSMDLTNYRVLEDVRAHFEGDA
jgi:5'-nucleotidase